MAIHTSELHPDHGLDSMPSELLAVRSPDETAKWLNLSKKTLGRMRKAGTGPRFVKLSEKRIGYRVADLKDWLNARTTQIAA